MGIYDREYYRDDSRGSGWFSGPSPACRTIIALNAIVFVCQLLIPSLTEQLVASCTEVFSDLQVWRLLTATFAHDPKNPFHILFNMILLWSFGRELEALYSTRDFVFMYLSAAVVSTLGWAAFDYFAQDGRNSVMGASGAVMAVAVVYTMFYPHREVLFMFVLRMELWVMLALFIGLDLLLLLSRADTKTAFAAHLAGAGYGFVFKTFDLRLSRFTSGRWRRPKLRVVRAEPRDRDRDRDRPRDQPTTRNNPTWSAEPAAGARATMSVVVPEEQLDAKLDEVLAKIAREGRGNLNDEENRVLQEASRRARNRRSDRP